MKSILPTLCLLLLLPLSLQAQTGAAAPTVTVQGGRLEGLPLGEHGGVFLGIPYAAPPVGPLRWKEPQPVVPWTGLHPAKQFGPSAMQPVSLEPFQLWTREFCVQNLASKDCLYLNVWTPALDRGAKLPVLVYIHGGAFFGGSGEVPLYDGANLTKQGVVVVTINYRLGTLGFFSHPELSAESPHKASGNYGLMDQIAALRWVRDNIPQFGGDAGNVTIWGQSAGAMSVSALILSPEAKGLFQKAVANSGLDLIAPAMMTPEAAERKGLDFAARHHAKDLRALRDLPATDFCEWENSGPVADGWILPAAPGKMVAQGIFSDVPVLAGNMANDAYLDLPKTATLEEWTAYAHNLFGPLAADFLRLYPVTDPARIDAVAMTAARDRERVFLLANAEAIAKNGGQSPFHLYFFTYPIPCQRHPENGAFHTAEMPYLFDNLQVFDLPWEEADRALAKSASARLVNFAKTGHPDCAGGAVWPPADPARPELFRIDVDEATVPVASPEKLAFWRRVLAAPDIAAKLPVF